MTLWTLMEPLFRSQNKIRKYIKLLLPVWMLLGLLLWYILHIYKQTFHNRCHSSAVEYPEMCKTNVLFYESQNNRCLISNKITFPNQLLVFTNGLLYGTNENYKIFNTAILLSLSVLFVWLVKIFKMSMSWLSLHGI